MPQGASKKKPGNAATGKKQNVHKRKPQTKKGGEIVNSNVVVILDCVNDQGCAPS